MKYFAQTLFDAVAISSANTSGTSVHFDIGELSRLWLQVSATGTTTTSDISVQLYVSNDAMVVPRDSSTWIAEGSAATFTGTAMFDKHVDLAAQKAKVTLTRNASTGTVTIRASGKP